MLGTASGFGPNTFVMKLCGSRMPMAMDGNGGWYTNFASTTSIIFTIVIAAHANSAWPISLDGFGHSDSGNVLPPTSLESVTAGRLQSGFRSPGCLEEH